jgi:hypothetical protein
MEFCSPNLAADHPDVVRKIERVMAAEHTPSPHYDAPEQSQKKTEKPGKKTKAAALSASLPEENADPAPSK